MKMSDLLNKYGIKMPNIEIPSVIYQDNYKDNSKFKEISKQLDEHNARKDKALFDTADAAIELKEILKEISGSYRIIIEQIEYQAKENVELKKLTSDSVKLMRWTFWASVASIFLSIILFIINK